MLPSWSRKGSKTPSALYTHKAKKLFSVGKCVVWVRQGPESSTLAERPRGAHATGDSEILIMACRIFQSLQLIKWRPIMILSQILTVFSHGFRCCAFNAMYWNGDSISWKRKRGRWGRATRVSLSLHFQNACCQDKSQAIDCASDLSVINWLDGPCTTRSLSAVIDSLIFLPQIFFFMQAANCLIHIFK